MNTIAFPSRFSCIRADAWRRRGKSTGGFSLVELLCVLAIVSVIAAAVTPTLSNMNSAGNLTNASDTISAALQRARTYAMAHNTYVWVGFYEEAEDASAPTAVAPPYTGKGRVVIGIAASNDGTSNVTETVNGATVSNINPIEKLLRVPNVHLTSIGAPPTSVPAGDTSPLDNRPSGAYSGSTLLYGISSDDGTEAVNQLTMDQYTFYKTVRFSPSGEAIINDVASYHRINEIGIEPTHGDTPDSKTPNLVAVQFTGIGGNVQIYRK